MKAYVLERTVKIHVFPSRLIETPAPKPKANEVLIDIRATGLNFFDYLQIQGLYQTKPKLPWTAGTEFSGVIAANSPIPSGCSWIPGKTRVFGGGLGAWAEQMALPWTECFEIPDGLSFEEAAGFWVTFCTGWCALKFRVDLQPGETLLVHAGTGGIGSAAVKLGKMMGAKVIATAGSQEKLEVCLAEGADAAINYKEEGWQAKVIAANGGKKVDVVYDPVGMAVPSMKCIAWNGKVIIAGFANAIEKMPTNLILLKNVAIVGVAYGQHRIDQPERYDQIQADVLRIFRENSNMKPVIYQDVYEGLESIPEALEKLSSGKSWGKVVVKFKPRPEGKL